MSKHTPGPWAANFEAGRYVITYQAELGPRMALAITGGHFPDHEANARLIAAAPELLSVLLELKECSEYWSEYDVPVGIHDRINSAIAKATGESQ